MNVQLMSDGGMNTNKGKHVSMKTKLKVGECRWVTAGAGFTKILLNTSTAFVNIS